MSTCPREDAAALRRAARGLDALEATIGVDVLDPNAGPRAEWTIEATLTGDRLPAPAVQILADQDCAIVSTTLRAPDVLQLVATA